MAFLLSALYPYEGLLGLIAGLDRHITISELDADLLQESTRRFASGEDPNVVVGNFADPAIDLQECFVLPKFGGQGIEQNLDSSRAYVFLDTLGISFLDPAETLSSVRESNTVAFLICQTHSRFDGAIAATHDEYALIDVVIRFDQPIHHFGQFLAFHTQFSGIAAAAQAQNYSARDTGPCWRQL